MSASRQPTSRSPRQRRHARTRQSILDAARGLLVEQGVDGLSMREIARRIDYSPAGLYEYFDGKDAILAAICEEGNARLGSVMDRVPEGLAPEDRLVALGLAYLDFAFANAEHYKLMFATALSAPITKPPESGADGPYGTLQNAIQHGIDMGAFTCRPNFGMQEMAYAAWALVHGIAMLRLTRLGREGPDIRKTDQALLSNLVRGLAAGAV
jgi:AcrR family transcriptional regulator